MKKTTRHIGAYMKAEPSPAPADNFKPLDTSSRAFAHLRQTPGRSFIHLTDTERFRKS